MSASTLLVFRADRFHSFIALIVAFSLITASCKSDEKQAPVASTPAPQGAQQPATPSPAPVVTQASWAPDALEELLAPIALYPDQLLAQVLAASVNSQEVLDGGNWLLQNQNLKGNDLDTAAQKVGFGAAMRSLMQFPTVVDMLCQEIDWTRQVGAAFNSDQKSVLDAVQRLRKQAADVGNLKSSPQQTVSTKSEGGTEYVEVKPADPKVVYVPQYDPQAVYTEPPPAAAATPAAPTASTETTSTSAANVTQETNVIVEQAEDNDGSDDSGKALVSGLIGFGVGMIVGSSMNDDYYYPQWGAGVYYGPRPFYPPAYAYAPVYGGAFRPAYGYAPPVGYRNSYNNIRGNNNVVINNKNYYNRFNNNQNLRAGGARSPIASTRPAAGRDWKGQSSYAGSRDRGSDRRLADNSRDVRGPNTREARAGNTRRDDRVANNRDVRSGSTRDARRSDTREARAPNTREARAGNTREARPADNRQARESNRPSASDRAANRPSQSNARADRGYDNKARATTRQGDTAGLARSTPKRESAFSSGGTRNSGSFDRSASARGNASAGSRQTSARAGRR